MRSIDDERPRNGRLVPSRDDTPTNHQDKAGTRAEQKGKFLVQRNQSTG